MTFILFSIGLSCYIILSASFEFYIKIYSSLDKNVGHMDENSKGFLQYKVSVRIILCLTMLTVFCSYFCLAYKNHKYEYKQNRSYIILYTSIVIVQQLIIISFDYVLLDQVANIMIARDHHRTEEVR